MDLQIRITEEPIRGDMKIRNNRSERAEVKVPVWEAEIPIKCRMKRLLYSYKEGYTTEYEEYLVEDGEVVANMGPHSALVLGMRNEEDHDWLYIL